jgi:hypothetical protein
MENKNYMKCNQRHLCNCGTATKAPHIVGKDGCTRFMVRPPKKLDNGMYRVERRAITEYTMRHQRGFSELPCGCWSRWNGSINSLPDNT